MLQKYMFFILATSALAAVSPNDCKIESIKNPEAEEKHEKISVYSEVKVVTCNALICLNGKMSLPSGMRKGGFAGTVNKDETLCMSEDGLKKMVSKNLKAEGGSDLTIRFMLTDMSKDPADEEDDEEVDLDDEEDCDEEEEEEMTYGTEYAEDGEPCEENDEYYVYDGEDCEGDDEEVACPECEGGEKKGPGEKKKAAAKDKKDGEDKDVAALKKEDGKAEAAKVKEAASPAALEGDSNDSGALAVSASPVLLAFVFIATFAMI
jgi:hypothetical protein